MNNDSQLQFLQMDEVVFLAPKTKLHDSKATELE